MIVWQKEADLTRQNSLGFSVCAERYLKVEDLEQLRLALDEVKANNWPLLILGEAVIWCWLTISPVR